MRPAPGLADPDGQLGCRPLPSCTADAFSVRTELLGRFVRAIDRWHGVTVASTGGYGMMWSCWVAASAGLAPLSVRLGDSLASVEVQTACALI
jgi:hypothetical protein